MAFSPSVEKKEIDKLSSKKNAPSSFVIWLKKMTDFFRRNQRAASASRIKKDINRLEEERSKEHAALLKQRHFYEDLMKKKTTEDTEKTLTVRTTESSEKKTTENPEVKPEIKPEIKIQPKSEIKTEIKPVVEVSKSISSVFKSALSVVNFPKSKSLAKKLAKEREEEESIRSKSEVEGRSWQAYNGVKANLIKDQGVLFFNWRDKVLTLVLSLVLCCLAISLVYVGLLIWQKERLSFNQSTLANYDAINIEISKNEKEVQEIVDFNKKLEAVNYLLSNHIYWSNFFSFLEDNTLKDVYFSSFSGDLSGNYKIPAVARNLDAISTQLEIMKTFNMVKGIQYSAAQNKDKASSTVQFSLELSVDPRVFIK